MNGEDPIEYVYDDDNLQIHVGEMTITRDPETGREVSTQLGNVTTLRTYTAFGEPESYTAKFGETEIYFEHLTYNKLGWITDIERRQNGFHELLHCEYDNHGRLEEVWRDGALDSSYSYDDNSNRLSYTGPLGNATGTYDSRDRVLTYGDATYNWTEAGELLTKTEGGETATCDYDVFGNLREVELPNGIVVEYLTDGAQRRIGKKVDGVLVKQWLYRSRRKPLAELSASGHIDTLFVYGMKGHVPAYLVKGNGAISVIADQLGSPRLLVNTLTGVIHQELRYSSFGETTLDTAPSFQPFGHAGGMYDSQLKMVRQGLRDYSPRLGRWLAPDPIRFNAGSTNLFEYVNSRPIHLIDPAGLAAINNCKCTVYVKPNTGPFEKTAVPVPPGESFPDDVDGVAVPWRPGEEFKAVDDTDIFVSPTGDVTVEHVSGDLYGDLKRNLGQAASGGWLDGDFQENRHSKGDHGWDELFKLVSQPIRATQHQKTPKKHAFDGATEMYPTLQDIFASVRFANPVGLQISLSVFIGSLFLWKFRRAFAKNVHWIFGGMALLGLLEALALAKAAYEAGSSALLWEELDSSTRLDLATLPLLAVFFLAPAGIAVGLLCLTSSIKRTTRGVAILLVALSLTYFGLGHWLCRILLD